MLGLVAVAAVNGDIHLTRRDLDHKRAYEAAKAGIDDYAFHLTRTAATGPRCTTVPEPNAVNQLGSDSEARRSVPGSTGATYAIELIPANGQTNLLRMQPRTRPPACSRPRERYGTFRIRSTGFAGKPRSSIVATFKPASFLDYVYFTQLETLDPVTYGYPNPSTQLTAPTNSAPDLRRKAATTRTSPDRPAAGLQEISFAAAT